MCNEIYPSTIIVALGSYGQSTGKRQSNQEAIMRKQVPCPKINKDVYLTFDLVDITTNADSKRQYIIGLFKNCSACKNICEDCFWIKELQGKPFS